jgi:hypothetical protein
MSSTRFALSFVFAIALTCTAFVLALPWVIVGGDRYFEWVKNSTARDAPICRSK